MASKAARLKLGAEDAAVVDKGGVDYANANTTLIAASKESFVPGSHIEGRANPFAMGGCFPPDPIDVNSCF
jgi:hypothetical protein